MTDGPAMLSVEGITKEFPGVKALDAVNIELFGGLVTAIIGENGAGKSTLMKILSGVYQDYDGTIYLQGSPVKFNNAKEAQDHGICIIHQELNLIPDLNIRENIFLGRESLNSMGFLDIPLMREAAKKILNRLHLDIDPDTPVYKLKVGQQQLVEIAKALSLESQVIIMDEPTSAISDNEVTVLFGIIEGLRKEGKAIAYISHKLDELFRIAENFVILRDGQVIETGKIQAMSEDELIHKMVGRQIERQRNEAPLNQEETILAVRHLHLKSPVQPDKSLLKDISFELKAGEVCGIFGLMGAGRTELLEVLFGMHYSDSSGEVVLHLQSHRFASPREAIEAGVVLVPEDRKKDGLVLGMDIGQNSSLPILDKLLYSGFLDQKKENKLAEKYMKNLKIKASSSRQNVGQLSGGNQQKVVLAKWLATHPKVLLLDEPTRGIDVNAKNELYKLIRQLASNGLGLMLASSELPEILTVCNRVLVMAEGRITADIEVTEHTSEDQLLKAAIPNLTKPE